MAHHYIQSVLDDVKARNPNEKEFNQAVREVYESLDYVIEEHLEYKKHGILERLVEADRIVMFKVTWQDDNGKIQVNRGYRVQFSQAIGPYKGGLRFSPTVNLSILKFLGFEQTFKNALTGLSLGGAKGGSDFDPKDKSDSEIMRFCQSFMSELYRHIGQAIDIPAGDLGVGEREIGYMFGMYKKIRNEHVGVLTGKSITYGGSKGRVEATGYGIMYFLMRMLRDEDDKIEGKRISISGSGNVAIFAAEKASDFGATVVAMSDSAGTLYDASGIDIDLIKKIKLEKRGRIKEYLDTYSDAEYYKDGKPWQVEADIAIPCATQNEVEMNDAEHIIKNGYTYYIEGSNMPTTDEAMKRLREEKLYIAPSKAANAGGVVVSGLEMGQNAVFRPSSFLEVNRQLQEIMEEIYDTIRDAAQTYTGDRKNLIEGANIAGFMRVAEAMIKQGYVF